VIAVRSLAGGGWGARIVWPGSGGAVPLGDWRGRGAVVLLPGVAGSGMAFPFVGAMVPRGDGRGWVSGGRDARANGCGAALTSAQQGGRQLVPGAARHAAAG